MVARRAVHAETGQMLTLFEYRAFPETKKKLSDEQRALRNGLKKFMTCRHPSLVRYVTSVSIKSALAGG